MNYKVEYFIKSDLLIKRGKRVKESQKGQWRIKKGKMRNFPHSYLFIFWRNFGELV